MSRRDHRLVGLVRLTRTKPGSPELVGGRTSSRIERRAHTTAATICIASAIFVKELNEVKKEEELKRCSSGDGREAGRLDNELKLLLLEEDEDEDSKH